MGRWYSVPWYNEGMAKPLPPIDELFDRFYVDSTSPSGLRYVKNGRHAGTKNRRGYWRVKICGTRYPGHRIVQALRTGKDLAALTVDHLDRNPSNNHIFNLRWATMTEQALNRSSTNRTGYKGVHFREDKNLNRPYQAQIWLDGKMRHLGMYETAEAAHEAYVNALQTYRLA